MANPLPAETPAQPLVPLAIQLALAAPSQPPDAGQALPPGGASPPGALAAAPWGLDAGTAMSAGPVGQGAQPTATAPPAVAAAGTPPSDGTPGATGSADAGGVPVLDATSLAQGLAAQPATAGPLPAQDALQALLKTLPAATVQTLGTLLPPGKGGADSAQLLDAVQRVQAAVVRQPDLPQGQGDALVQLLRSLLRAADPGAARGLPAAPAQNAPASPHAAAPEAWETWLKASMKALSDPAVSPREAPFHAAQAKEGTALFEVPLPWGAQTPLQIWTEADGQGQGKGGKGAPTSRLLLGMSFSKLGETRLGLARSPDGLQVRVWAQHPEALLRAQASMEEELAELDTPVDLKILPLEPGPGGVIPSIRSIASGSTFQVLG